MSKTKQVAKKPQIERKPLDYYLSLNYPIIFHLEEDGGYTAEIKELPGCITQGETLEETANNIQDARKLWIETAYDFQDKIPLPVTDNSYSGKTLLRMPRSLHQKLAENAEIEGISLNQYLIHLLSEQNTSQEIIRLITNKIKNMSAKGIKKGKTITLKDAIDEIPDGTEVIVEIPQNQLINQEEKWQKLEAGIGVWQGNPQGEQKVLKIIDQERKAELDNSDKS